ncbi:MAG: Major facilitator transporter, partial [Pedosphaera sp.]|nr:Major facilitator transporter [Pedosphaera sp.]
VLFFGTFLNKFGTFVIPFLVLYMTRQGYSTEQAGMAIGAFGIGNFVASGLGGHLADTFGRRNTIVLSMFSGAVAMLLLSQAHSFWAIILLTSLVGLTGELYRPASSALLADLVPMGQRVTAYSAYRLAFNAGWAFGPATAGFLAGHSFFWLFAGDAATSLLFGVVAWVALPQGVRATKSDTGWGPAIKVLARDGRFLRVLGASLAIALVFLQMISTFGLHVTHCGISAATYGALISFNGVLVVLCELPLTTITQRFPARRVMALGYLLIGAGFAFNAFAHSVFAFAVTMLIFTFGEMISVPVSSAYVADLAPAHLRGRYMGVMGFTWSLALVCGPGLGMMLLGYSPTVLWLTAGALGCLAALIILSGKD